MGSPSMNLIPARVVMQNGTPHAEITNSEGELRALRLSQSNLSDWAGQPIILGIRPEIISDVEGADRKSANIQPIANRVTVTEPAGSDTFVTMTLGGKDVIARMRADANVVAEETFEFAINMEKAVVFVPVSENRVGVA